MSVKIKLKRGTEARWLSLNPVLASGEPGFAVDTNQLKVGNGVDTWSNLPSINASGTNVSSYISTNQDVSISGVSHNDVLVYNSGTNLWENNSNVVFSDITGITGASGVNNLVYMSQADYDNLATIDPNTVYFIV
jgi:hypothetical protein